MTSAESEGSRDLGMLAQTRLHNLHITGEFLRDPVEVVRWHGAMQAQDFAGVTWAVGLRMSGVREADVVEAFNAGRILRTHVLRPTWHFVTPDDIRWMLELTGPRIIASAQSRYRREGLSVEVIVRAEKIIEKTLSGRNALTRAELAAELNRAGFSIGGQPLARLLMRAELDGLICSGPVRGKQQTYALLDERVPQAKIRTRQEALIELTKRYFTSHGPASVKDFAWWSGLKISDVRIGIDALSADLDHVVINDADYWFSARQPLVSHHSSGVHLLPNYDEYIVGFSNRDAYWHPSTDRADVPRGNPLFSYTIVQDGKIIGTWARNIKRDRVDLRLETFEPIDATTTSALQASATRYGQFLGLNAQLV